MGSKREKVREFRGYVEAVISNQVEQAKRQRRSWPDYDKCAHIGGFLFSVVNPRDGRSAVIGHGKEKRWAMVTQDLRLGRYTGQLAVVSLAGQNDSLPRRWGFASPLGDDALMSIYTEKPILSLKSITDAVEWAKMPHIHANNFDQLAELTHNEQAKVDSEMAAMAGPARELQRDLDALARARRAPVPNIILD